MDPGLADRLRKIKKQIELLHSIEEAYLTLEAAKDHRLAKLILSAGDEFSSQAARETWAKATVEWEDFRRTLAIAEAEFHKQRHMLELMKSTLQVEYLDVKIEADLVTKG